MNSHAFNCILLICLLQNYFIIVPRNTSDICCSSDPTLSSRMQLVGSGRSERNLNRVMDPIELSEILLASNQYLRSLKQLDDNIKTAVSQIESSSLQTEDHVNNVFATLCQSMLNSLNARRGQLLRQIETVLKFRRARDCLCTSPAFRSGKRA